MPFPKTKGPPNGRCNICGEFGPLTEDHVPPKGTLRFPRMQLYRMADALSVKRSERGQPRNFQRGVKFRTTCKGCNRDVLGRLYDPELVRFSNEIASYLSSRFSLPSVASFQAKPGHIARAVLGHILAIGVERFPRGEMGDAAAEYVLDPSGAIPSKLGIYYWPYPFWDQVAVRGCGWVESFGAPPLVLSLLKFMPLAYMVTWDIPPSFHVPHRNLADLISGSRDKVTQIPVNFTEVPPQRYPEAPDDDGMVLHGQDSFFADWQRP